MDKEQIEIDILASDIDYASTSRDISLEDKREIAKSLILLGYGKVEDYKKEIFALKTKLEDREYEIRELNKKVERLEQSLSDCAFMTSSIGDLPINSIGLGKAVDEIDRLLLVEAELQELNAKYYNEAKNSRREIERLKGQVKRLKKYDEERDIALHSRLTINARRQAIKEFSEKLSKRLIEFCEENLNNDRTVSTSYIYIDFLGVKAMDGKIISRGVLDDLLKEYGIGEE